MDAPRLGEGARGAMTQPPEPWLQDAARWPLAFAQVREDPLLDLWALGQLGRGAQVIMVASGGCTAALLASRGAARCIHLVDPNPAQLALARLKLHLLRTASAEERLGLLGHDRRFDAALREKRLAQTLDQLGLPRDALGPLPAVAALGPDHAGRYEALFTRLRECMRPAEAELHAVLELSDPAEQARRTLHDTALCQQLHRALDDVMALPNLIALFGEGATRNRVEPFAKHFARRTRHALATLPANVNPYLWQMYRGCYPHGHPAPWFAAPAPAAWPEIAWSNTRMIDALEQAREPVDLVHLSNILDWLAPDEARTTLDLAAAALKPGGWVLIRQLNSTLDIPRLSEKFTWQHEPARRLHAADRSFFYRALHLGRKP